ncbi:MAG: hypothetical protein M0Q91_10150 [Methanoregula sp.]|jgi:hypothetical protein|nr:hypothetical protein [Methanoregula sp.]
MIAVIVCGWMLRGIVRLFGMETVACAVACSLPDPALQVLDQYLQEVPI